LDEKVGAFTICGAINGVAGIAERDRELPGEQRFVFNDENSHSAVIPHPNLNGT
jgi:hypothetical protein